MEYLDKYKIRGREMKFPIFFPDATWGVVRSISSFDIKSSGIEGIVVNGYHLPQNPGLSVIKEFEGIKKFMNFDGWIVSDSGGFQVLSLIYGNSSMGKITDEGMIMKKGQGGKTKKIRFTPENSIVAQFDIGADILICLDDCPKQSAKKEQLLESVSRTIDWAKRCKIEFENQIEKRKLNDENRPILLAVVQGGEDKELRKKCAEELIRIGFDGYAFGGWPISRETGKMNLEILKLVCDSIPNDKPKFALGVGSVEGIVEGAKMGYNIFDCVLPTRDARHKRLYVWKKDINKINPLVDKDFWEFLYIDKEKHYRDKNPVSDYCDCFTCKNYSKSYLRHLFEIEDSLSWRLATIHNLRFYAQLIEAIRRNIVS